MQLNSAIAIALRPIVGMLVMAIVVTPLGKLFERLCPEGRVKRFLLRKVGN